MCLSKSKVINKYLKNIYLVTYMFILFYFLNSSAYYLKTTNQILAIHSIINKLINSVNSVRIKIKRYKNIYLIGNRTYNYRDSYASSSQK